MKTEARRTDFNLGEIGRRGTRQSFRQMRWEGHLHARVQTNDDAGSAAIVTGKYGVASLSACPRKGFGLFQCVFSNSHGLISTFHTGQQASS